MPVTNLTRMQEPVSILGLGGRVQATAVTDSVLPGRNRRAVPARPANVSTERGSGDRGEVLRPLRLRGTLQATDPAHGLNLDGAKGFLFLRKDRMFLYAGAFRVEGENLTWVERDDSVTSVLPANDVFKDRMASQITASWEKARTYVSDADPMPNSERLQSSSSETATEGLPARCLKRTR